MEAGGIMHPEDAKAIQVLKRIKGFDALVRVSMEYGFEKIFRGENLGGMVKVNARNYPSLYSAFDHTVTKCQLSSYFSITDIPSSPTNNSRSPFH